MLLADFQKQLEVLIGNPTDLRPFVCEGSPLDCRIFIVGFSPATELRRSFWEFWQPDYGFRKFEWFEVYKQERRDKPLSAGKTRRSEISNTRRCIEWIVDAAGPVKCLETNIYSRPSETAVGLAERNRVTRPFDFLLNRLTPRAILVHGNDAIAYIEALMNTSLALWDMQQVSAKWGTIQILAVPHLSRGWSEAKAREIGQILGTTCGPTATVSVGIASKEDLVPKHRKVEPQDVEHKSEICMTKDDLDNFIRSLPGVSVKDLKSRTSYWRSSGSRFCKIEQLSGAWIIVFTGLSYAKDGHLLPKCRARSRWEIDVAAYE